MVLSLTRGKTHPQLFSLRQPACPCYPHLSAWQRRRDQSDLESIQSAPLSQKKLKRPPTKYIANILKSGFSTGALLSLFSLQRVRYG